MANPWDNDPIIGPPSAKTTATAAEPWLSDPIIGTPSPKERSLSERASGLYKAADEGVLRGVAGLVGLPGSLADLGKYTLGKMGYNGGSETPNTLPRPADIESRIRQGPLYQGAAPYQPQGALEDYALAGGEMLPGALLTGPIGSGMTAGRIAARVGAETLLPAIGSETAGRAFKGTGLETPARIAGAVVGGGVSALATRPGTAEAALQGTVGKLTQAQVDAARKLMEDAASGPNPIRLTWPEALSQVAQRPVLSDTMRHLEASPQSADQLSEFFGARPGEVTARVDTEAEKLAPGAAPSPSSVGHAVGRAAEGAVRDVEQARTAAVEPLYTAANQQHVPGPEISGFIANLDRSIAADKTGIIGDRLREIRNLLTETPAQAATPATRTARQTPAGTIYTTTPGTPAVPAQYITDIENLDRVRKYVRDKVDMPQIGADAITKEQGANITSALDDLKRRMMAASPEFRAAKQQYADISENVVRPVMEGPLGKLADKDITTQNAINALFPKTPNANSAAEVSDAVSRMAAKNPNAATDLVRQHVENAFNQAQTDLLGGANQGAGAKLRQTVFGNPQQRENLQAAIEAAHPDGVTRFKGFNRLMDVMEAIGTRQGIGSKTAYNQNLDQILGQSGIGSNSAKVIGNFPAKPLAFITDKYQQFQIGRNKSELARILTDPHSAGMLRSMAESSPGSQRALNTTIKLLNYGQAAQAHSDLRKRAQAGPPPLMQTGQAPPVNVENIGQLGLRG